MVTALGYGTTGLSVGQRVFGLTAGQLTAEQIVAAPEAAVDVTKVVRELALDRA